ncbi:hypothetical protein EYF80_019837 [Liparis tanakae]|uniref:Uncharacterized protein n=1 Tax=Liparis tanakae TaxID=230148 RepID=A0A4Z2HY70_9TELE|nr:hypothetical protein EYF80_019837 [Liparis tanakae]
MSRAFPCKIRLVPSPPEPRGAGPVWGSDPGHQRIENRSGCWGTVSVSVSVSSHVSPNAPKSEPAFWLKHGGVVALHAGQPGVLYGPHGDQQRTVVFGRARPTQGHRGGDGAPPLVGRRGGRGHALLGRSGGVEASGLRGRGLLGAAVADVAAGEPPQSSGVGRGGDGVGGGRVRVLVEVGRGRRLCSGLKCGVGPAPGLHAPQAVLGGIGWRRRWNLPIGHLGGHLRGRSRGVVGAHGDPLLLIGGGPVLYRQGHGHHIGVLEERRASA